MSCTSLEKVRVGELQQYCFLAQQRSELYPRLGKVVLVQLLGPTCSFCYATLSKRLALVVVASIQFRIVRDILEGSSYDSGLAIMLEEVRKFEEIVQKAFPALIGMCVFPFFILKLLHGQARARVVLLPLCVIIVAGAKITSIMSQRISAAAAAETVQIRELASCVDSEVKAALEVQAYNVTDARAARLEERIKHLTQNASILTARQEQKWKLADSWRQSLMCVVIYRVVGGGVMDGSIPFAVYHALFGLSVEASRALQSIFQAQVSVSKSRKTIADINSRRERPRPVNRSHLARQVAKQHDMWVDSVSLERKGKMILSNVSLSLPRGKVSVLVGSSGSGKTTLLRAMAGEVRPTSGTVQFGSQQIMSLSFDDLRSAVVLVRQQPIFIPDTVKDIMMDQTSNSSHLNQSIRLAVADDFLEARLQEQLVYHATWEPSGGEGQRIALARAFYQKPSVLLLDEPTSALDEGTADRAFANLKQYAQEKNIAILMVTHVLRFANKANQLLVMDGGKLVQNGTHKTLTKAKGSTYRALLAASKI